MKRRANQRGSTLIDICAACMMGSMTMALALPSYQGYLERTSREDAMAALERVHDAQVRHFEETGRYAMQLKQLDAQMPDVSNRGLYKIEMFSESPDSFEVHADAVPGREQAKDPGCAQIALRVTHGVIAYEPSARCWNR
jgi:type IV pilus assembly protein PilE